jgi:hypothetical protein
VRALDLLSLLVKLTLHALQTRAELLLKGANAFALEVHQSVNESAVASESHAVLLLGVVQVAFHFAQRGVLVVDKAAMRFRHCLCIALELACFGFAHDAAPLLVEILVIHLRELLRFFVFCFGVRQLTAQAESWQRER